LRVIQDGEQPIKNFLGYLFLPITIPIMFFQELVTYIKQRFGLQRRTLEGKVVLITGASSGIGESLAKHFYKAGCRLILASRRKHELERVKNDLVRLRTEGTVNVPAILVLDVGDLNTIPGKSKEALDIYGRVDILINNAGFTVRGSVEETEIDVHQQIMNVNYFGALALTRNLLPQMIGRQSGQIVFVSSVQGKISLPNRSAYSASKHAMQALADCLRAEIASKGIQVTLVSPGYVRTNLSLNALTGSGSLYGKMDEATAKGYSAEYVAERTFRAIMNGEKDVLIAPILPRIALRMRQLLPTLYFFIMARRAASTKD